MSEPIKYLLPESDIPTHWDNIMADLPAAAAAPAPGTGQPIGPDDLAPLFPMALIEQEVSAERWIEIPDEVREIYRLWRPSPLLPRPPPGAGARYARRTSTTSTRASARPAPTSRTRRWRRPTTTSTRASAAWPPRPAPASGARRWPSPARCSASSAPSTWSRCQLRAEAVPPVDDADLRRRGHRQPLASQTERRPPGPERGSESPESLGIAISEAVEDAATHEDTHYSLGSVLNHVCLHQTVIGQEALKQMEMAGEYPDVVIGCVGGGSNFAGLAFPFVARQAARRPQDAHPGRRAGVLPDADAGEYTYDFGDTVGPDAADEDVHAGAHFMPPGIHAGGLRYHGDAPLVSRAAWSRADRGAGVPPDSAASRRRSSSPAPRASSPRPSRRTRSARRSTRRSAAREAGERARDPVQPLRPRPLRHGRLRRLLRRRARRPRVLRGRTWRRRSSAFRTHPCPPRGRYRPERPGEVTEWLKVRDWKSRGRVKPPRGFVVRCNDGPVTVDGHASGGWRLAIGNQTFRSGDFSRNVALACRQGVHGHRQERAGPLPLPRALPADDFPTTPSPATGRCRRSYFAADTALPQSTNRYAMIFDNHGVPIWWYRAPAVGPRVLPNGNMLWFLSNASVQCATRSAPRRQPGLAP